MNASVWQTKNVAKRHINELIVFILIVIRCSSLCVIKRFNCEKTKLSIIRRSRHFAVAFCVGKKKHLEKADAWHQSGHDNDVISTTFSVTLSRK